MSDKDEQIGVRVDPETKEMITDQLDWGDSISDWVREAIEHRIEEEGLDSPNPMTVAD